MSHVRPRFVGAALLLVAAILPSAAHAQQLAYGRAPEVPILRLALGLVVCTFIAVFAVLLLKRFMVAGTAPIFAKGGGASWLRGPQRHVRVLESHRLSPHADICRLVCKETEYLVVVSPGGATVLHEAPTGEAPA